jgi:hypothetical protein
MKRIRDVLVGMGHPDRAFDPLLQSASWAATEAKLPQKNGQKILLLRL